MKQQTFYILIGIILIVFVALFAFGSCSRKSKEEIPPQKIATNLHKPFDAKATIKLKDLVLEADVNKTDIGACNIKVKEPKSLKDISFKYDGDKIVVDYKGLSVTLDENSKLVSAVMPILINTIDKAASPSGINVQMVNKALTLSGDSDSGKFEITLDKQKGSIAKISVPELDFECNFSDFVFK